MRRTRLLLGIALIAAGPAVGVFGVRAGPRRSGARAGVAARVGHRRRRTRGAEEKTAAEKQVWEAARLEPLEAALRAHVDGPTLVDLFENEDWWRPYRREFPSCASGSAIGSDGQPRPRPGRRRSGGRRRSQEEADRFGRGRRRRARATSSAPRSCAAHPRARRCSSSAGPITLPALTTPAPTAGGAALRRPRRAGGCSRSPSASAARRWWSPGGGALPVRWFRPRCRTSRPRSSARRRARAPMAARLGAGHLARDRAAAT